MRVLLDEQLSRRLRHMFPPHEIATVAYQSWRGIKNGALLHLAEEAGFDVLLTADKNLRYQQNLQARRLALVVLSTNDFKVQRTRIAAITMAIENSAPGSVTFVDCFSRDQP